MRRIGLIGGMSWESTAEYYRLLNQGVRDRLGGLHSAWVLVASVDFAPIERMQQSGDWEASGEVLAGEARALRAAGAELIMIGTNTMHKVYDQVAAAVDCPVLHLGDVTARAVRAAGLERIGLLATRYTMEQDFYRQRLADGGVESLIPDEADREQVQRIIYDELCVGVVTEESRELLIAIGQRLVDRGARGIVLGCTELELSVRIGDLAVPVFPTTALHCQAALDAALAP
ncbi:aspartate racemase [Catenulispora sp. MAP12-49]|uniref:aspartate/glutamate racemase family protein n=1 Tax=Catenulispora sp. MAP12-49 TaxID=3156302 RepID=UPI0035172FD1